MPTGEIKLENKLEKHTKNIAMMLADMAHFIPREVVAYIAEKNKEQFSEFEEMFEGRVDISHYLFEDSSCVFPSVRRWTASEQRRGAKKLKYDEEAMAILEDNQTPRSIWCFLLKGQGYSGRLWANTELNQFELAHIFPHKEDGESLQLVRDVFDHIGDSKKFFSYFSGAGNVVLLPKGTVRPTDTSEEIKIAFFLRYIELYGEGFLLKGFRKEKRPSWYDELKWNELQLPYDWKSRMDSLIYRRTKFVYEKLHNKFEDSVKKPPSLD